MTTTTIPAETIRAAQCGDADALWVIVSACEPLAETLINSIVGTPTRDQRDDLMQDARLAVIEAVQSYDLNADSVAAVTSYAYPKMRAAIQTTAARARTAVSSEPSTVLRVLRALHAADENHELAFLTVDARYGMSRDTFTAAVNILDQPISIDGPAQGGRSDACEDLTVADVLAVPDDDAFTNMERAALAEWLLSQISARYALVLRAFYGVGMQTLDDAQTAAQMGVTPATVRQTRRRALDAARAVADAVSE